MKISIINKDITTLSIRNNNANIGVITYKGNIITDLKVKRITDQYILIGDSHIVHNGKIFPEVEEAKEFGNAVVINKEGEVEFNLPSNLNRAKFTRSGDYIITTYSYIPAEKKLYTDSGSMYVYSLNLFNKMILKINGATIGIDASNFKAKWRRQVFGDNFTITPENTDNNINEPNNFVKVEGGRCFVYDGVKIPTFLFRDKYVEKLVKRAV